MAEPPSVSHLDEPGPSQLNPTTFAAAERVGNTPELVEFIIEAVDQEWLKVTCLVNKLWYSASAKRLWVGCSLDRMFKIPDCPRREALRKCVRKASVGPHDLQNLTLAGKYGVLWPELKDLVVCITASDHLDLAWESILVPSISRIELVIREVDATFRLLCKSVETFMARYSRIEVRIKIMKGGGRLAMPSNLAERDPRDLFYNLSKLVIEVDHKGGCTVNREFTLFWFASHCPRLLELHLGLNEAWPRFLPRLRVPPWDHLKKLSLTGFTPEILHSLRSSMPALQSLRLDAGEQDGRYGPVAEDALELVCSHWHHIVELELRGDWGRYDAKAIKSLGSACPNLKRLILADRLFLGFLRVFEPFSYMPNLEELEFSTANPPHWPRLIMLSELLNLGPLCPKLSTLRTRGIGLDDVALHYDSKNPCFPSLRHWECVLVSHPIRSPIRSMEKEIPCLPYMLDNHCPALEEFVLQGIDDEGDLLPRQEFRMISAAEERDMRHRVGDGPLSVLELRDGAKLVSKD